VCFYSSPKCSLSVLSNHFAASRAAPVPLAGGVERKRLSWLVLDVGDKIGGV
jgi:hypothetical protein